MAGGKVEKTNAMRLLDQKKLPYQALAYPCKEFTDGVAVANLLGLPAAQVYKTLVAVGKCGGHYVFVLPVEEELDRKKAAAAVGEKSMELVHVKDLFQLTGYVRGGCTALGMKKQFPTVLDRSAERWDAVYVSGGRRGLQLRLAPQDLLAACGGKWGDLLRERDALRQ